MYLKKLSAKWLPFCFSLNELIKDNKLFPDKIIKKFLKQPKYTETADPFDT